MKNKHGEIRTADCQEGYRLTRSFISAFMMGDGLFCARVVADHSPQKHSRPLFRTPLIAEDPGCAGPGTEIAMVCEIDTEERSL